MEQEMEEENINCYSDDEKKLLNRPHGTRKGGLRTIPFIILNESFEKVASYGLMPNMIFYLTKVYHMEIATGSIILSLWSATSNALGIFGAFLSDSYLGRFRVIVLGSISSFLGMSLLWLTAAIPQLKPPPCEQLKQSCLSPSAPQLAVLFASFGLISIGAGCVRPCSMAFGADQLDDKENPNNERILQSFFNWYYVSTGLSAIFALTLVVYIQDRLGWQVGFAVPAIFMVFSSLVLLLGSSHYIKVKASESLFTGFIRVLVVAYRKRNISPPSRNYDDIYHQTLELKLLSPSDNLSWLDKAYMTEDHGLNPNPDGSTSNWNFCTMEQVQSVKALLRVIPIWSTSIIFSITMHQLSFSTLQAKTMDRHITPNFEIPAGSFIVFMIITVLLSVAFYDRVLVTFLTRHTGCSRGLIPEIRMGIGLFLTCLATGTAAIVESRRRKIAIDKGLEEYPDTVLDMSAMWLVPQYIILGVGEAFYPTGQIEFYYSQFPKSMSSIPMALITLAMAISSLVGSLLVRVVDHVTAKGGKISWLSSNLNKGHIDYYYWFITLVAFLNFVYFLKCSRGHRPSKDSWTRLSDDVEGSDHRK